MLGGLTERPMAKLQSEIERSNDYGNDTEHTTDIDGGVSRRTVLLGGGALGVGLLGLGAIGSIAESEPSGEGGAGGDGGGSSSGGGGGGAAASEPAADERTPQPTATPQWQWGDPFTEDGLEIADYGWFEKAYGNIGMGGYATNVSDGAFSYAQIEGQFYDFTGTVIGSSMANINNLAPGQTWNFEIMYIGLDTENVDSFSFTGVTVY
jgi:hypothetical protein